MMSKERELLERVVEYMWVGDIVEEIKELLAQPEQDLDALKKDWVNFGYTAGKTEAPPKREPLSESEIAAIWGDSDYDVAIVRAVEKAHGIGGEPLSNEQKRLEAIAIKQREAHGFGGGE